MEVTDEITSPFFSDLITESRDPTYENLSQHCRLSFIEESYQSQTNVYETIPLHEEERQSLTRDSGFCTNFRPQMYDRSSRRVFARTSSHHMPNPDLILPLEAWTDFTDNDNWSETLQVKDRMKRLKKKQDTSPR